MKRIILAMVIIGLWAVPAWANHSQSTGINCSNFAFQEDAQAYFEAHPGDPEGLDGPPGAAFTGVQGVACEDLPRRGSSATTTTSTTAPATTTTTVVTTTTMAPATTTTVAPTTTTTVKPAAASEGRVLALTG